MHRRSKEDPKWNDLRDKLKKRDPHCRVIRCLTISEAKIAEKIHGFQKRCDCAHVLSVGSYPELTYNEKNCYRISRTFHSRLDNYQDPITEDDLDRNKWSWWWWRIINKSTEKYDEETPYEDMLKSYITET